MAVINTDTGAECTHADTYSLYLSLKQNTCTDEQEFTTSE